MHDNPNLTKHRALQLLMTRKAPISAVELAEELGVMQKTAQSALRELCIRGQATVIGCRINKNNSKSKLYEWVGTTKAASKEPPKYTPWSGVDWSASTLRAGCIEHERIPSLRNGRRVQHRPPFAMVDSN